MRDSAASVLCCPLGEHEADEELARRAAGGDKDAFSSLWLRHGDWMVNFGRRSSPRLADPAVADEWANRVLDKAVEKFDVRQGMSFRSWLNLRARSRIPRPRKAEPVVRFFGNIGDVDPPRHRDRDDVVLDEILLDEIREDIKECLAELSRRLGKGRSAELDQQVLKWMVDKALEHPSALLVKTKKDLAKLLGRHASAIGRSEERIWRIAGQIQRSEVDE